MKTNTSSCCDKAKVAAWVGAVVGTFLLMAFLVNIMLQQTAPPPVDQVRAAERAKARAEVLATGTETLTTFGKVDEAKGLYRVPIEQAMKATIAEYKNPAAARTNFIARVEKATAVPPKPPEKPNVYE
ncbi:MAG: hypothetical protein HZA90_28285 [Verrucomicrobia bacterium]|nr:hypothetical protein [Verrucomicrobiota bacterium]